MINLLENNNDNILSKLYEYIHVNLPTSISSKFQRRPGMHPSRWNALNNFFRQNKFKSGLEFGRATGYTAVLFTLLYPEATIDSIDSKDHPWQTTFFELMGVKDRINVITGISWESIPKDKKYDYVLIDGDHTYAGAKKDWQSIQNNLLPGAIVLFDDLTHKKGCGKVYEEINLPKSKICSELGVIFT